MRRASLILFIALLQGCASQPDELSESEIGEARASVKIVGEASVEALGPRKREALTLPDLLYAGLQALDADRLLTPEDSSAYDYFTRALA